MKLNKKKIAAAGFVLVLVAILSCSAARFWLNKTIPPFAEMTAELGNLRIQHGSTITKIFAFAEHFLRLELLVCLVYYLTQTNKITSFKKLLAYFAGGMLAMLAVSLPFGFFDYQTFSGNYFWDVFPFLIQMISFFALFLLTDTYRILKAKRADSISQ